MGCIAVKEDEVAIVEKFGKFSHISYPGFEFMLIPGVWVVSGRLSKRVAQTVVKVSTKTKDNVFVQVTVAVQVRVIDTEEAIYDAFYKLSTPEYQIISYVEDVVRAAVPTFELDVIFVQKAEIAHQVKTQLTEAMSVFGYEIRDVLVANIEPDSVVKASMNEINVNRRHRVAQQEMAEAQKYTQVKAAEAQAEATYLAGEGLAKQRGALVKGLEESVAEFSNSSGVSQKDTVDLLVITQYFDTLKAIGGSPNARIIFSPKRAPPAHDEQAR
eukprot:GHVN01016790.1.p1 GENE.GHVN01016790.1~~GHVN01016790.1.p1  ORF type:complete len:271 (+),score=50.12 GHVN01016790.1:181-993(+)